MPSPNPPLLEGPVQFAYHVTDARRAALEMVERTGAGPFFLLERIRLTRASHRGEPVDFVHSSAYGQSGPVMIELVEQNGDGRSPFRDLYAAGEEGLHHTAYFARDLEAAVAHFEARGMPLATRAEVEGGQSFVFIDAVPQLGHMIELYEPTPLLRGFYDVVRRSAEDWRGADPIRSPG